MVQGLDKFKNAFRDFSEQYVLIGGTACDINLSAEGEKFRSTKDLDMVLIVEALTEDFVDSFFHFVNTAKYEHINKSTGKKQFYRFEHPATPDFPYMIELFCKRPDFLSSLDSRLAPIHITDDVSSLSAILLNDEYYEALKNGSTIIDGVSVLNIETLVLFKIKAFLDLTERKSVGEKIDSKKINKHKNDIFRLAVTLDPDTKIKIEGAVYDDFKKYLTVMESEDIDPRDFSVKATKQELLFNLKNHFVNE